MTSAHYEKLKAVKENPPFKRWDIAVYVTLVLLVAVLLIVVLSSRKSGDKVTVYAQNAYFNTYPLDRDGRYDIDGHMTLVVAEGVVWVESADCPDKVCMSQKIYLTNDPIYCLPNKITIVITKSAGFDPNDPNVGTGGRRYEA